MLHTVNSFDDSEIMDLYASEEHTDDNEDIPVLTGNETDQNLLDYMVLVICRRLQYKKAFKDGYLLNQLLEGDSRMTKDIDFSIDDKAGYEQVKAILCEIGEKFKQVDLIEEYRVKETITETSSGGVDFYDKTGKKVLGVDVGLHSLSWGITSYDFEFTEAEGFEVERMLADKTIAILSRKRFRRTKDLYDFYILTNNFDIDLRKVKEFIDLRGNAEWDNIPFNEDIIREYKRAWDKLNLQTINGEALNRPEFMLAIQRFYTFVLPMKKGLDRNLKWDCTNMGIV